MLWYFQHPESMFRGKEKVCSAETYAWSSIWMKLRTFGGGHNFSFFSRFIVFHLLRVLVLSDAVMGEEATNITSIDSCFALLLMENTGSHLFSFEKRRAFKGRWLLAFRLYSWIFMHVHLQRFLDCNEKLKHNFRKMAYPSNGCENNCSNMNCETGLLEL